MILSAETQGTEGTDGALSLLHPLENPSPRRYLLLTLGLAALWALGTWIFAEQYSDYRERVAIKEAERVVADNTDDLTDGLRRNLAMFHSIPAALGRDQAVHEALAAMPPGTPRSIRTREVNRERWQADPTYARLNVILAESADDIAAVSAIWVMNIAGDCVASSNAATSASFVGTNFADREYFVAAKDGRRGNQFAVGRVSGIPGLYFSAPVSEGGQVVGVIAVKIDLPVLSYWMNIADAFITDANGVIILAQNKHYEMHSLPGSRIRELTPAQRLARYRREEIPELSIAPWNLQSNPVFKRIGDSDTPVFIGSREIPDEALSVTMMAPVPIGATRKNDQLALFAMNASIGILAIFVIATASFYIGNWRRVRRYCAQQSEIEYLATHDTLTGLFSRATMGQLIQHCIGMSERTSRRMAVLFIDLDQFKNVNDSLGHEAGDEVLRQAAKRFLGTVRSADAVVRHGGDEFVVLLNDLESADDAARVALKLIEAASHAFHVNDVKVTLSASVGIAVYPEDGSSATILLRNADSALYHVKENGRADFHFFDVSLYEEAKARFALESELRGAIERREFVVYYQPQWELASGRITGCEALVRWQHPAHGMVRPDLFIPIAEKVGLIVPIDEWVMIEACRQTRAWQEKTGTALQVAVNVSAVNFRKPGMVDRVRNALDKTGLLPQFLELELTESAVMENPTRTTETLRDLKRLGVRIAIDDFGTGYSSLAYLKRFAPDVIKIDRTFVRDIGEAGDSEAIIEAILLMAKSFDCHVVAEGVESTAHAERLKALGCDSAQGYWLAKPLPADAFADLVAARAVSGEFRAG